MSIGKEQSPRSIGASEYINDNFEPDDRIALLLLNRETGETLQRITTAKKASSPEFQAWLRHRSARGDQVYLGMNALKEHASTRTKEQVAAIRHLYIDLDHGGEEALERIRNSALVPQPNYVLNTSPGKSSSVESRGHRSGPGRSTPEGDGAGIRGRSRRNRFNSCLTIARLSQPEVPSAPCGNRQE
jgi:hypothetical protein